VGDSKDPPREINIGPLEPETFAYAQPEAHRGGKQRFEPMTPRGFDQESGFVHDEVPIRLVSRFD
jgi:hypothetical protein